MTNNKKKGERELDDTAPLRVTIQKYTPVFDLRNHAGFQKCKLKHTEYYRLFVYIGRAKMYSDQTFHTYYQAASKAILVGQALGRTTKIIIPDDVHIEESCNCVDPA